MGPVIGIVLRSEASDMVNVRRHPRLLGLVTEESIYGTILVSGMIVVAGGVNASSWETFLLVLGTVLVFWAAHVYAGTVAEYGQVERQTLTLGTSFRRSLERSLGFLLSALLPSIVLLLGALRAVPDTFAVWFAMWLCVAILGVVGYAVFALRGSHWAIRIAGCLGTAVFGLAMIGLKVFIH